MINISEKVVGIVIIVAACDAAFFSDVSWRTGIRLSEYYGYRSATFLTYDVPQQSLEATFSFEAKAKGNSCPVRDVHIFLQHGSYPLLEYFNETFPPNFFINRTNAFHIVAQTDADTVSFSMSSPVPGLWYVAAVLLKQSSKIQPKEFGNSCNNGLFVTFESSGLDNVPEMATDKTITVHLYQQPGSENAIFRVTLPESTVECTINVTGCAGHEVSSDVRISSANKSTVYESENEILEKVYRNTNESPAASFSSCPVTMRFSSSRMPFSESDSIISCGNRTECQITIFSPLVQQWNYIFLQIDDSYNVSDVQFNLQVLKRECKSFNSTLRETVNTTIQHLDHSQGLQQLAQDACVRMNSLGRFTTNNEIFNITYLMSDDTDVPVPTSLPLRNISVPDDEVLVVNIEIQPFTDIGGTLKMHASLNNTSFNGTAYHVMIHICLLKNAVPGGITVRTCENGLKLILDSASENTEEIVNLPYPEAGSWFLGINSVCSNKSTSLLVKCSQLPSINMELKIKACLDGQCGEYGICQNYVSGVHVFSSCKCFADWRGYGCTDGTYARSRQHELLAVLLLTLSNLFFIPAIIIAVYRRYFVEAGAYFFTMFFSLFYHACDTSDLIGYCLLEYSTLSFSDYFGSINAFWVTLLAMAAIPAKLRAFALTVGAVGMAVGVANEPQGILKFAVPAGFAAAILLASWVRKCVKQKHIYPDKRYFLRHLMPGGLLAVTGLVLFFTLETQENYMYTHSAWHMMISLSIVFLLPERRQKVRKDAEVSIPPDNRPL